MMMTKEEVYSKIAESEELSRQYRGITDQSALKAFLSASGYDAGTEDFIQYVKSRYEGEIDDLDAERIAGGGKPLYPPLY